MPSYKVLPIPGSLLNEAAALSLHAFQNNASYRIVFPQLDSPASTTHEADRIRFESESSAAEATPKKWHVCVVDTDLPEAERKILTYANFYVKDPAKSDDDPTMINGRSVPPDANKQAWNFLVPQTAAARTAAMGKDATYVYLATLATAESARKRGCGTLVLEFVKDLARARGFAVGLQATADGLSLYERNGFKRVAEVRKDLSRFGGGVDVDVIMRWDAENAGDSGREKS